MDLWTTKLVAWLHDPPEKALVLMRTPGKGHEEGTSRTLLEKILGNDDPGPFLEVVRVADRMASAADRPDRPRPERAGRFGWFADRVRFPDEPALVHPLSGDTFHIGSLAADISAEDAEAVGTQHLAACVADGPDDLRRFLRLWRMAPELHTRPGWQSLWRLLPADTRIPDHSIWEHLGLVSALAGSMHGGEEPALLLVTLGPVQSFIEQGRSTSDLWAGSHLLAWLAWQAMRPIADQLGPDSLIFPSLRGNPFCDAWLLERNALSLDELKKIRPAWGRASDAHPLFAASLPNRFLAIVPAGRAAELGALCASTVRECALRHAKRAWRKILDEAGVRPETDHAIAQIERQVAEFPEVHWTAVRWPKDGRLRDDAVGARIAEAVVALGGSDPRETAWWKLLADQIQIDGAEFFNPNTGVLYPAVVELAERAQAAARATRAFEQLPQVGYRCSLCGEREWLSPDHAIVRSPRAEGQGTADPWPKIARKCSAWARGTEHLCGICTLKRLWPALFVDELKKITFGDEDLQEVRRYVVSTHTMALVPLLERLTGNPESAGRALEVVERWAAAHAGDVGDVRHSRVALPQRFVAGGASPSGGARAVLQRLPATVEAFDDAIDAARGDPQKLARLQQARDELLREVCDAAKLPRVETYYALLLVDGDRMGAWMAGAGEHGVGRPALGRLWHPTVRQAVEAEWGRDATLRRYLDTQGLLSPAYHAALSSALCDLSLHVFPYVVERVFHGKVLYAGGDDLLAMLPVHELLPAMLLLRRAYAGLGSAGQDAGAEPDPLDWLVADRKGTTPGHVQTASGFVLLDARPGAHGPRAGRLFRTLGARATCSMGAIVAHHTAPLQGVLHELRGAERRAKASGRDAFSITLDKRGGGTTFLTAPFALAGADGRARALEETPLGVLFELQRTFVERVSRQGAYNTVGWIEPLCADAGRTGGRAPVGVDMLAELIGYQLDRASDARARGEESGEERRRRRERFRELGQRLAGVGSSVRADDPAGAVVDFIRVAEFLARDERRMHGADSDERPTAKAPVAGQPEATP
jgi:CRISPR-associated protein Cmr2